MNYSIQFTEEAESDVFRLYGLLLKQDPCRKDLLRRALTRLTQAIELLKQFPFTCRKVSEHSPYLRELIISFGTSGYVALFEIEPDAIVTVLAVRYHRESDYE